MEQQTMGYSHNIKIGNENFNYKQHHEIQNKKMNSCSKCNWVQLRLKSHSWMIIHFNNHLRTKCKQQDATWQSCTLCILPVISSIKTKCSQHSAIYQINIIQEGNTQYTPHICPPSDQIEHSAACFIKCTEFNLTI